jgi:hypothetical protein
MTNHLSLNLFLLTTWFMMSWACPPPGAQHAEKSHFAASQRADTIPPPPPPIHEAPVNGAEEAEKIKKELEVLESATREFIEAYSGMPKPKVNVSPENLYHLELKQLDCDDSRYHHLSVFDKSIADAYESSSENTGLTDGKVFCLRSVASCASCTSKLLFKRNEGGHVDDTIELLTIRGSDKKAYHLPLYYHFGKDGYDLEIESELEGTTIRRTITERYGWSKTTQEELAKQPRSETRQEFEIQADGRIAFIQEKTGHFNFDRYLKQE